MKKLLCLFPTLLIGNAVISQECGTDYFWSKKFGTDWREQIKEPMIRAAQADAGGDRATYTIPVVVHIIHDGGEGNISYDQVLSAIQMLNEDYSRTNADTINTRNTPTAPFEPQAADMDIEFKLAKIDPWGDCTNGVDRRYSPTATVNANDAVKHYTSGGLNAWTNSKYLNIWVVESIESSGAGTTLGYAYLPYWGIDSDFGILVRHDAFGTSGTASGDRTISHEMGHTLGLLHTFEEGCHTSACDNNGDYVCDTPPEAEAAWSCVTTQNTCTGVPSGDTYGFDAYNQFENFMSYSPCQNMFSKDQQDIVDFNLGDVSIFINMTSASNLVATGVNLPDILCSADFTYDKELLCAGNTVQFTDLSYSNVTGWNWSFPGGTPSSSTDQHPVVTYNTAGIHSVTLEVTDGTGFVETTMDDIITVLSNPGEPMPYSEGFEDVTDIPDDATWMITNEDGSQHWDVYIGAGSTGSKCTKLKNFGIGNGSFDELISGPIDLSSVSASDALVFNFKYAYKRRSASNDERLRVFISKDCGETWVLRETLTGDELGPEVLSSSYTPETPTNPAEWYQVDITTVTSTYFVSDFMIKFEFMNDQGNNIYIDDINIYPASMSGLSKTVIADAGVYPNPANDVINIALDLIMPSEITLTLYNTMGQKVATVFSGDLSEGPNTLSYSLKDLPAGIYQIRLGSGIGTRAISFVKL